MSQWGAVEQLMECYRDEPPHPSPADEVLAETRSVLFGAS